MIEDFNKVQDLLDSPDPKCIILGKEIIKSQYPGISARFDINSDLINTVKALIRSGDRENIILGQELYKSEYPSYEFGFIN